MSFDVLLALPMDNLGRSRRYVAMGYVQCVEDLDPRSQHEAQGGADLRLVNGRKFGALTTSNEVSIVWRDIGLQCASFDGVWGWAGLLGKIDWAWIFQGSMLATCSGQVKKWRRVSSKCNSMTRCWSTGDVSSGREACRNVHC